MEDDALVSTVSGRMSSGGFGFNIETDTGTKYVTVSNSQIEIDAAYEGINYGNTAQKKVPNTAECDIINLWINK